MEKAEQILNLYHRSPKRLRNCQHRLPLESWRMRCMKKLLKTGGWIKFCFKMQLSHKILSLFYPAGRFLFCHLGRRGSLFSGEVAYPRTRNIWWIWRKKNLTAKLRDFTKFCALNVQCSVPLFSHFDLGILGTWLILSLMYWMVHLCRISMVQQEKTLRQYISIFFMI